MQKNISLLGSTGSIGRNVLKVVRQYPGRFRIVGLAAGRNISLLRDQIEAFNPLAVSVATEELARELARSLPGGWSEKIFFGREGNELVATIPLADTVVSSIVGAAGLMPTMAAIKAGKNIALANKETLVMAGDLVMAEARRNRVKILPVDSEHNAIFQALAAGRREDVHKIILTASGGPFRDKNERDLWDVTPEEALNHPNWSMGNKISIDSATLMNKGLEVIEARWLFDIDVEHIEVLVHPQSIVHSLVEYSDRSVLAQLGPPDMRIAIAYALAWPQRAPLSLEPLDLVGIGHLTFEAPALDIFPCLAYAFEALRAGASHPVAINAANEIAVELFLSGAIGFMDIPALVGRALNEHATVPVDDLDAILAVDGETRAKVRSWAAKQ